MNDDIEPRVPAACAEARETLQDLLDGPVEAECRASLDAHLGGCPDCREVRQGLEAVRWGLRALPRAPMPDDALREVWARTVHAGAGGSHGQGAVRPLLVAMAALAASALAVVMLALWADRLPTPPVETEVAVELTPAELERVRRDTRQALELTVRALSRSQRTAVERVLENEVSPAIRKIGIQWPEATPSDDRRSKT